MKFDLDVLLQQIEASRPETRKNWRRKMIVKLLARASILVKDEISFH
jgi:hypothetical protein